MGEIPRLKDDANGYRPNGKNFISHIDIPREIEKDYEVLKNLVRNNKFLARCEL
jgi:hypothetical protein